MQALTCPNSSSETEGNYDCPRCKDTGYIPIDNKTVRICPCMEQKRIEKLFESSQITPALRQMTLENYTTDKTPISKDMLQCGKLYLENYKKRVVGSIRGTGERENPHKHSSRQRADETRRTNALLPAR